MNVDDESFKHIRFIRFVSFLLQQFSASREYFHSCYLDYTYLFSIRNGIRSFSNQHFLKTIFGYRGIFAESLVKLILGYCILLNMSIKLTSKRYGIYNSDKWADIRLDELLIVCMHLYVYTFTYTSSLRQKREDLF